MDTSKSEVPDLNQIDFDQISLLIRSKIPFAALLVFGSFAKGRQRPDSDLDIALVGARDLSPDILELLKESIANLVMRDVDLINFAEAPPPLQAEIMRNSVKMRVFSEQDLATEFMKAMKFYEKLNEERSPSLDKRLGKNGWKHLF